MKNLKTFLFLYSTIGVLKSITPLFCHLHQPCFMKQSDNDPKTIR